MKFAQISRYLSRTVEAGLISSAAILGARLTGYLLYVPHALGRLYSKVSPPPEIEVGVARGMIPCEPAPVVLWDLASLDQIYLQSGRGGDLEATALAVKSRAAKVVAGELTLLGWGSLPCGQPFPWHSDVYRCFTWPLVFHKFVRPARLDSPCDVKVPWELSRLQFLPALGQAWVTSRDPAYLQAFWNILRDWAVRNPVGYGVNWTCSMEVAIRAVNIAVAANLFGGAFTHAEAHFIQRLLRRHYRHIRFNLEISDVNGNHYFFDLLGLSTLSILLFGADSKVARRWTSRYLCEVERQFHPDGVHIENATGYHRLVLDGVVFFAIFCSRSKVALPEAYYDLIERAERFLRALHASDGTIPLVGDSDSGNLLILGHSIGNDVRTLLQLCELTRGIREGVVAGDAIGVALWRCVEPAFGNLASSPDIGRVPEWLTPTVMSYRDGGYFIWKAMNSMVLARCGESGLGGRGSHDHNDQLAIAITVFGLPLLVDPGTHNYTQDLERHKSDLSTGVHSTVLINGLEQSPIVPGSVTSCVRSSRADCTTNSAIENGTWAWAGHIDNYGGPNTGLRHVRRLEVSRSSDWQMEVTVFDSITSNRGEQLSCTATYAIDSRWVITPAHVNSIVLSHSGITVEFSLVGADVGFSIESGEMSPEYGMAVPMNYLRVRFSGSGQASLVTTLRIASSKAGWHNDVESGARVSCA